MAFKLTSDVVYALSLVSLGGIVSVTFISMGYFEPIVSGLIALAVGVVLSQFSGVVKYFGYGLVAGGGGGVVFYIISPPPASTVHEI